MDHVVNFSINFKWLYILLIVVALRLILKIIFKKVGEYYLKRKYHNCVRKELIKSLYLSMKNIEENKTDELPKLYIVDEVNDLMDKILPKRVKFGGTLRDDYHSGKVEDFEMYKIDLGMKLPFPFWRTVVLYTPGETIYLDEVKPQYRDMNIDSLLK